MTIDPKKLSGVAMSGPHAHELMVKTVQDLGREVLRLRAALGEAERSRSYSAHLGERIDALKRQCGALERDLERVEARAAKAESRTRRAVEAALEKAVIFADSCRRDECSPGYIADGIRSISPDEILRGLKDE